MNAESIILQRGPTDFLMKKVLQQRDITVSDMYTRYTKGVNKMYTREHLSRILNGKRSIPIDLAKNIAAEYNFNWTEFYQIPGENIKFVDAGACKTHELKVVFKQQPLSFYCPKEYVDSHWAVYCEAGTNNKYFANSARCVHMFQKLPTLVSSENVIDALHSPLMIKTKAKDFYVGFLTGYSTPIDKHEPHLWLGFFGNPAHYMTIPISKIKQLHYLDFVMARPKFLD